LGEGTYGIGILRVQEITKRQEISNFLVLLIEEETISSFFEDRKKLEDKKKSKIEHIKLY